MQIPLYRLCAESHAGFGQKYLDAASWVQRWVTAFINNLCSEILPLCIDPWGSDATFALLEPWSKEDCTSARV